MHAYIHTHIHACTHTYIHPVARNHFAKVLYRLSLYSKYTRALTFENVPHARQLSQDALERQLAIAEQVHTLITHT